MRVQLLVQATRQSEGIYLLAFFRAPLSIDTVGLWLEMHTKCFGSLSCY